MSKRTLWRATDRNGVQACDTLGPDGGRIGSSTPICRRKHLSSSKTALAGSNRRPQTPASKHCGQHTSGAQSAAIPKNSAVFSVEKFHTDGGEQSLGLPAT